MKTLTADMAAALEAPTIHLVTCVSIVGALGDSLRMTSFEEDLIIDGEVYRSDIPFDRSAVKLFANLDTGDMSIDGRSVEAAVQTLFRIGALDGARVFVFSVIPGNLAAGRLNLIGGYVGSVVTGANGRFRIEVQSAVQRLSQTIGPVHQPECRADLGDSKCKVDLTGFTKTGTVLTVAEGRELQEFTADINEPRASADTWFAYGVVTWLTGANARVVREVRLGSHADVKLRLPTPSPIQVGDTFRIVAGCDKRISTCIRKYRNAGNFQGEPAMPGNDYILDYQTDILVE